MSDPLRVTGIGRAGDHDRELSLFFNRRPTDDELRRVHEIMRAAVTAPTGEEVRAMSDITAQVLRMSKTLTDIERTRGVYEAVAEARNMHAAATGYLLSVIDRADEADRAELRAHIHSVYRASLNRFAPA